jgi:hypothetical protein
LAEKLDWKGLKEMKLVHCGWDFPAVLWHLHVLAHLDYCQGAGYNNKGK